MIMNKQVTRLLAVSVIWLMLTSLSMPADKPQLPSLKCDNEYNFGKAENYLSVEHVFPLMNIGRQPVKILGVRSSCKCIVGSIATDIVRPGEEVGLPVKLYLYGKVGHVSEQVFVVTNDPAQPQIMLRLTGSASENLTVQPHSLIFEKIGAKAEEARAVRLVSRNDGSVLQDVKVICESAFFSTMIEQSEDQKEVRVTVKTKPPLPYGHVDSVLKITSNNRKHPIITIPVVGYVCGPVVATPDIIRVVRFEKDQCSSTRFIQLKCTEKEFEFRVLSVDLPDPKIVWKVVECSQSEVMVRLEGIVANKELDGKIIAIRTNVTEMPVISIPISVLIAPTGKKQEP